MLNIPFTISIQLITTSQYLSNFQTPGLSISRTSRLSDFPSLGLSVFSLLINKPLRDRLVRINPAVAHKGPVCAVLIGLGEIQFHHFYFFFFV